MFSPGSFKDQVFIHWRYHSGGTWQTSDRIPIKILGGREEGYRVFTYKNNFQEGDWEVLLETDGGRVIGSLDFKVVEDDRTGKRDYHLEIR